MTIKSIRVLVLLAFTSLGFCSDVSSSDPSSRPIEWTTSRIRGTPDPPLPFTVEQVYADVPLLHPTELRRVPGSDRLIVTQQDGLIQSFSTGLDRDLRTAIDMDDLPSKVLQVFGIAFHPNYPETPSCYITYMVDADSPDGSGISQFTVSDTKQVKIDPTSEIQIMRWPGGGHGGGSMQFGRDGYLYISIGDGGVPNPPDPNATGQVISDLQASVLRIDVSETTQDRPYRIPDDNPFVNFGDARGEVWAFGLRNPWKMAFDPNTDTLWTGDVGWEMREMIYRVDRGANYGWSLMEGSQLVREGDPPTGIPITPPIVEHTHLEARSITGGDFWTSSRLPELKDAYLYGDWMTGKIWGLRHDGSAVTWHQELADTTLRIICFAVNNDGEVLVVNYDGGIYRLLRNEAALAEADFPRRLSETGLFESTADQTPAPGVIPYAINAHHWADNTQSMQWIAVPGRQSLEVFGKSDWQTGAVKGNFSFPENTVLAKTIIYRADAAKTVNLETQLLHRLGDEWKAYNYIWNDEQTDAVLQDNVATDREIVTVDSSQSGGFRKQTWHHASRDECLQCHAYKANTVHGFKLEQLTRDDPFGSGNQIERLTLAGIFQRPTKPIEPIVSPIDESKSLEARARSYLHMNCAHCHRFGGGGTGAFQLLHELPLDELGVVDAPPTQGTFGMNDAKIVASGDPSRSVLFYRLMKTGRGHMPQFGPTLIDDEGVRLVHDWIESISSNDSQSVSDRDFGNSDEQVSELLASTEGALRVSYGCLSGQISEERVSEIADVASTHPNSIVRDLFERFLPEDRRVQRLGSSINAAELLSRSGDVDAGRELYFQGAGVSCRQCHKVDGQGENIGPDLSGIGAQRTRPEILDSILNPSAKIEPKYQGKLVLTVDGDLIAGLVTQEDADAITLADAAGKQRTIATDDIESIKAMETSVMPDKLLGDFTAQQAADLLAFLAAQKKVPILRE